MRVGGLEGFWAIPLTLRRYESGWQARQMSLFRRDGGDEVWITVFLLIIIVIICFLSH